MFSVALTVALNHEEINRRPDKNIENNKKVLTGKE